MESAKILVVDDDPDIASANSRILQKAGYDVLLASSGRDCLTLVKAHRPDLILLDVGLPDVDGVEVCRQIKSDVELSRTFIIHISGMHISSADQAEGLEAGADGYLIKPVDSRVLLAQVRGLLRIKHTEDALRESEERHRSLVVDLQAANRRLEEFNRLKAEFVANMSHELRTPLTAIIGFAQLVLMKAKVEPLSQPHEDAIRRILHNGRHLLALVDDVLDLSKIEAGRIALHPEPFGLEDFVRSTFEELMSLAQQSGIGYQLNVVDELPLAYTDPIRVRQVIINLLSNAIKFTREGSVKAELRRSGEDRWELVVQDTGIGIRPEALSVIFERFRQVDGSSTRAAGGTGLGLYIAQQIAGLLGGKIEVASSYGEGSMFTLSLPFTSPGAESAGGPRPGSGGQTAAREQLDGGPAQDGDRPLVLVVEDDPDARSLLSQTLMRAGYRVETAADGGTGLQMARDLRPSAVTLDVMMPGMDGWRVLRAMKSDARTVSIPVVVCSIVDNRPLGYRLGASEYLVKPISPEHLIDTIMKIGGPAGNKGGYVLVVDDEHGVRELLVTALRQAGYEARTASSGETALALCLEQPPVAILCDLMMPGGMSGFELIARLRAGEETAQTPIVVITGKDITSADRQLLGGQIAEVIRKGDLFLPDLESRLKETLEEIGVEPTHGESTAD